MKTSHMFCAHGLILFLKSKAANSLAFSNKALTLHQRTTYGQQRERTRVYTSTIDPQNGSESSTHVVRSFSSTIAKVEDDTNSEMHLSEQLISKLDIGPLITHISGYACTKRGKEAILSLVSTSNPSPLYFNANKNRSSSRNKRLGNWYTEGSLTKPTRNNNAPKYSVVPIANSATEATCEYELVRQAMQILKLQSLSNNNTPLPPMFQLRDRSTASFSMETDDDEWINVCLNPVPLGVDIAEEIDLEMILQAEQVTRLLLSTYEWAMDEQISIEFASLSEIISNTIQGSDCSDGESGTEENNTDTALSSLSQLYETLKGAVEIVRGGPSFYDINNQFSYQFRLAAGNGRFYELDALRQREEECIEKLNNSGTGSSEKQNANKLAMIREEISALENEIQRTLISAMIRAAPAVECAFKALARLDVIFCKATFACEWNGVIPEVVEEGRVEVRSFIHPVLAIEKKIEADETLRPEPVVPIDLILPGQGSYQALMISGPNSGGKTLALKSFGLAAIMVKLALPIPVAQFSNDNPVVVDFFRDINVEVGDNQSLKYGESTLMARLNALSALIEKSSAAASDCESFQ